MIDDNPDVLPGQISYGDRMPANYSSPDGYFVAQGYNWEGDKPEPIYKRANSGKPHFDPKLFRPTNEFRNFVNNFIKSRSPVFLSPQSFNKNIYIGVRHKLNKLEIANNMIAFRNSGYLPLDDIEVQKVIKKYFKQLQPRRGKTTEQVMLNLHKPLEVFDKESSIYVVNFKNGISNDTIQKLFALDFQRAVNSIQKLVTAPVNQNQYAALVSLAFDVEEKRLRQSTLINKINKREYHKAVSYFVDFSMIQTEYRSIVNESQYKARILEAELFSSF